MNEIKKLSIGRPKEMHYSKGSMITAIDKAVVDTARLEYDGFQHDEVADKKHHGGTDRAVCIYPYEHYKYWENEFGAELPESPFGENLTVTGMTEDRVHIGDIYKVGSAVIQVTQGRMPCVTIDKQTQMNQLMKRMIETGYTGYLCKVIEPGDICHDDVIELLEQGDGHISVEEAHEVYYHDQKNIPRIEAVVSVDVLADRWKSRLIERLHRLKKTP